MSRVDIDVASLTISGETFGDKKKEQVGVFHCVHIKKFCLHLFWKNDIVHGLTVKRGVTELHQRNLLSQPKNVCLHVYLLCTHDTKR